MRASIIITEDYTFDERQTIKQKRESMSGKQEVQYDNKQKSTKLNENIKKGTDKPSILDLLFTSRN